MKNILRIAVAVFGLVIGLGSSAAAEDNSQLRTLLTGNDAKGWRAVGRIDIGGQAFCTGALIAPELVLTAAHCLYDKVTGEPVEAQDITFLADWRQGYASATRAVGRAFAHPGFAIKGSAGSKRSASDLALLELSEPILTSSIVPYEITDRPAKWAEVGVVSYAHNRAQSPSLQEGCDVLARQGGALVLSCEVDFGSSGSPVFVIEDGKARIASVISAKAVVNGREVSIGTDLQSPLADLLEMRKAAGVLVKSNLPSVNRHDEKQPTMAGRAKFVRP